MSHDKTYHVPTERLLRMQDEVVRLRDIAETLFQAVGITPSGQATSPAKGSVVAAQADALFKSAARLQRMLDFTAGFGRPGDPAGPPKEGTEDHHESAD